MIAPFLSTPDADTVALDFGVFIAEKARAYRTSQTAIIAALLPTIIPNQQPASSSRPRAAAASTSSHVDAQAEGGSLPFSASPTPEPQPTKAAVQMRAIADGPKPHEGASFSTSLAGAEGIEDRHPIQPESANSSTAALKPSEVQAQVSPRVARASDSGVGKPPVETTPSPDQSGEVSASPAPRRTNSRELVLECHKAHPDWPAPQIAKAIGLGANQVRVIAGRIKITLPPGATGRPANGQKRGEPTIRQRVTEVYALHPDWSPKQIADALGANRNSVNTILYDLRAASREAEPQQPAPAPTPQTPVAPPPPNTGNLTDRVRIMNHQHPTWTARMIANELGAKLDSVAALLTIARKGAAPKPEPQAFANRREMVEHYGQVAARLGKALAPSMNKERGNA